MSETAESLDLLDSLIAKAKAAGAESADALYAHSIALSHARRLGEVERLEREESRDLGLRVLIGKRQAIVSSSDISAAALDELAERAVDMARAVPEDPHCGLAEPGQLAVDPPSLEILDDAEPSTETLIQRARDCETAALDTPGITNSEGAEASWSYSRIALAGSNGFAGSYATSRHGLGVAVLAGEGLNMERDYEFTTAVYGADLDDPAEVGRKAAERTVRRLGARKPETGQVAVVYDPRIAGSLLGHLAGAINGTAIARGTSFLKDELGKQIFAPGITVMDDPHRPRGLRSKPFDAEGVANQSLEIIRDGSLTTWILDLASARKLGLTTSGRAARGTSSPPSPSTTNLYMAPGENTPEDLMADIKSGFYVTEMMGMGVNGVTGDYSRGAAGYWIENGEITHPVSEVTVAGNLKDVFANITPANNLEFRYGTNAPTLRVDGMTVAGA